MSKRSPHGASVGVLLFPLFLLEPQTVTVDSKPGATFEDYQTYAWLTGARAPDELTDRKIVSEVEDALATKGFWRDDQKPDLYLSYYAATKSEVQIESPYRTSWYDEGTIRVRLIHEGTLALDVVDVSKNELLWRGVVTRTLTDDPSKNLSRIRAAVRKLLEGFPP